jgi:hypothetical protein
VAAALTLCACAQNANHLNTVYLDRFATPDPTLAQFTVCHGFNCTERSHATLNIKQWRQVAAVFRPRAKNAQSERQQIAHGVALIERLVGPQTGTAAHQWTHKDMLIYPNLGDTTQLDCVDESVNTWTYMMLMERGGLLHFHRVAQLANAGGLTDPFMRNTAVLQEIKGDYYAVDASLVDGGQPPIVMPLTTWMGKWPPDVSVAEAKAKPAPERTRTKSSVKSSRQELARKPSG